MNCGRVDGNFVRSGEHYRARFFERPYASSGSQRYGEFRGNVSDRFEKCGAAVARCCDVQDDQFVGAFCVVACSEFGRIASVAQSNEVDAFDDARAVRVEAGNDSPGEGHCGKRRKFCKTAAPFAADFSGWNCTAQTFSRSTTAANGTP